MSRKVFFTCDQYRESEFRRVVELAAELGATHVYVSQIEPSLWQWDRNRYDPYPNWSLYQPSLFKFLVPEELKEFLPEDYAKRNLDALVSRAAVLKEFGLKAAFQGIEPAWLPEEVFRAHPTWRGPRCDQARRARTEYYAPCIDNGEVQAIYVKTIEQLCRIIPLEHFHFLTNDSGGGLCWDDYLYPGKNGPILCKNVPTGRRITTFLSLFQDGAARAGLEATVNVMHILPENVPAILPFLKPGQSVNNQTMSTPAHILSVGFTKQYTELTTPMARLTRIVSVAQQLQTAQKFPEHDLSLAIRALDDTDTIRLYQQSLGKIAPNTLGKYTALQKLAESFVSSEDAGNLVDAWDLEDHVQRRFEHFETGGCIFALGTVHQRWLTRPLVAFPNELKPEEKDYYRKFQFQAQEESDADNMLDLQAHRWLNGYSGQFLLDHCVKHALPELERAIQLLADLREKGLDAEANSYLEGQWYKMRLQKCVLRNAVNVCCFQVTLDRTNYQEEPRDTSPWLKEQGDPRFLLVNEYMRAEIDNTLEMIQILETAPGTVMQLADTPELETVMLYGPDICGALRKKITIMENHRRDFTRLYKSNNR
ncbi:MAG: hypothetical protein IJJ26_06705 [Victivallales bacterium]|nr:hypothetical protein [Victivallales bacterium]